MNIKEQLQEGLDDYILKTNEELVDDIICFGLGETDFHTTDIERLIKENEYLKKEVVASELETLNIPDDFLPSRQEMDKEIISIISDNLQAGTGELEGILCNKFSTSLKIIDYIEKLIYNK